MIFFFMFLKKPTSEKEGRVPKKMPAHQIQTISMTKLLKISQIYEEISNENKSGK